MAEWSLVAIPAAAIFWLTAALPSQIVSLLTFAAFATIIAGVFVVARYKAASDADGRAITAIVVERDAAVARADRITQENERLAREKIDLVAENVKLAGKPDQSAVVELLGEMTGILRDIHTATVPPK